MIKIEEEEGRQGEWEACRWGDRGRRVDMLENRHEGNQEASKRGATALF